MPFNEQDRDLMIRTILGEASNQPPEGQAAVAHVILNRAKVGKYGGRTPSEVVLAPGQFEPWQTRAKELQAINPNSKAYKNAAKIVDGVVGGNIPDPTNGASHFLQEEIVRQRRGGTLPNWARGEGLKIGGHTFYYPDAATSPAQNRTLPMQLSPTAGTIPAPRTALDAISMAIAGSGGQPVAAMQFAEDTNRQPPATAPVTRVAAKDDDLLGMFDPSARATPAGPTAQPAENLLDLFAPRAMEAVAPSAPAPNTVQIPGAPPIQLDVSRAPSPGVAPAGSLARFTGNALSGIQRAQTELPQRSAGFVGALPGEIGGATADAYRSATDLFSQGRAELGAGNILPSTPSFNPTTWSAGGAIKTAGGALGGVLSPVTGTLKAGVENPVARLTGNPAAGEKANLLASTVIPLPKAAAAANQARPSVKAVESLLDHVGVENFPDAIARMKSNPRLALADVAPSVRIQAQSMIDPAQPKATAEISKFAKERMATAKGAVEEAYESTLGKYKDPVKLLDDMKESARKVGEKEIQPVIERSKPVDVGGVIAKIEERFDPVTLAALKEGKPTALPLTASERRVWDIHKELAGNKDGSRLFDPEKIHRLQSRLRTEAETRAKSVTADDKLLAHELRGIRGQLVDAVDDAAGKQYKPGLAKYADEMHIQDAFEKGMDIVKNPSGIEGMQHRPESWAKWLSTAKPAELVAAQEGARDAIRQHISSVRNAARRGMDLPEATFTQDKLQLLFGEKQTKSLVRLLRDERDIAETNNRLIHNSKTAETLAGRKAMGVREVTPVHASQGIFPIMPLVAGTALETLQPGATALGIAAGSAMMASKGAHNIGQRVGRKMDLARNKDYASWATATGEKRNQLISIMENKMAASQAVRGGNKLQNLLSTPLLQSLPR